MLLTLADLVCRPGAARASASASRPDQAHPADLHRLLPGHHPPLPWPALLGGDACTVLEPLCCDVDRPRRIDEAGVRHRRIITPPGRTCSAARPAPAAAGRAARQRVLAGRRGRGRPRRAGARGVGERAGSREPLGIIACTMTELLISPISWPPHWVWVAGHGAVGLVGAAPPPRARAGPGGGVAAPGRLLAADLHDPVGHGVPVDVRLWSSTASCCSLAVAFLATLPRSSAAPPPPARAGRPLRRPTPRCEARLAAVMAPSSARRGRAGIPGGSRRRVLVGEIRSSRCSAAWTTAGGRGRRCSAHTFVARWALQCPPPGSCAAGIGGHRGPHRARRCPPGRSRPARRYERAAGPGPYGEPGPACADRREDVAARRGAARAAA